MKRIDFENGTVTGNILGAALPMLVAQILNLLYNIVDRIYIARIPEVGTAALGASGTLFSCYRDHYSICKSVWWRWCALIFHRQRKKERARGNTYYEYVVFACMFQCFVVNDDRTFILPSDSDAVWSIQKCNGLCTSVS